MKFERLTELLDEIASAADGGIEAMRNATLSEGFRLLAFFQDEQKNGSLAPQLSQRFAPLRTDFVKRLFANGMFYVIFSAFTKCHQEVDGAAAIAVDLEAGKYICRDLEQHRYHAVMRPAEHGEMPAMLRGIAFNGFERIRLYKSGCPCFEVPLASLFSLEEVPQGAAARFTMLAFLQELRRGIPPQELSAREKRMYDVLNGTTFFLPTLWETAPSGDPSQKKLTHPCVQLTQNGQKRTLLPVYTASAKLLGAPDYRKMCEAGKNWQITQMDYKNLIRHCEHTGGALDGIVVDSADLSLVLSVEMLKIHCNI